LVVLVKFFRAFEILLNWERLLVKYSSQYAVIRVVCDLIDKYFALSSLAVYMCRITIKQELLDVETLSIDSDVMLDYNILISTNFWRILRIVTLVQHKQGLAVVAKSVGVGK
jgi:hypothetical protein